MDIDPTTGYPIVPQEVDTKSTTSTSGGHVMSKASGGAIKDEYAANKAAATAQGAVGEAEALAAAQKADQQAIESDRLHAQAADQAADHQAYLDRIDRAREAAANAEEKFKDHKFEDFWSHQSVGKRIASAFSLFGGGASAAYLGNQNPAAIALQRAVAQDFDKQKAQYDQKREAARQAGADVNDLFAQEGHENAALAIKHAKAAEATAASMAQAMTEAGIPLDQARNNVAVQKLLATAQEKRREALQHYDRTFSGSTTNKQVDKTGAASNADQRLALQKKRTLEADQERWFKENKGPAIADANRSLHGIEAKVFDEKGNIRKDIDPATQQMVIMELDKASKGGTATGASMAAVLGHLGGTGDKFNTLVEQAGTGKLGRGAWNIIASGVKAARRANKAEAAELQHSYNETYYQAPEMQSMHPDLVTGETKYLRQFGYAQRPGAAAAPAPAGGAPAAPPPPGAPSAPPAAAPPAPATPPQPSNRRFVRLPTGETGYLASDGTFFPSAAPTQAAVAGP